MQGLGWAATAERSMSFGKRQPIKDRQTGIPFEMNSLKTVSQDDGCKFDAIR